MIMKHIKVFLGALQPRDTTIYQRTLTLIPACSLEVKISISTMEKQQSCELRKTQKGNTPSAVAEVTLNKTLRAIWRFLSCL